MFHISSKHRIVKLPLFSLQRRVPFSSEYLRREMCHDIVIWKREQIFGKGLFIELYWKYTEKALYVRRSMFDVFGKSVYRIHSVQICILFKQSLRLIFFHLYLILLIIISTKVCENGWMFATLSRKNYWTDLNEIWYRDRLKPEIIHRLPFIPILSSCGTICVFHAGEVDSSNIYM